MNNVQIIIWVLAGVFGLFGLIFAVSKKKKVMDRSKWLFAIPFFFIGFFLLALQVGWLTQVGLSPLSAGGVIQQQEQPGVEVPGVLCAIEDTTVTLSTLNKYTSLATGGTQKYKVNGGASREVADSGTFTASPGDVLTILWNNASVGNGYFSDVSTEVIPCKGTKTYTHELFQNGTVTIDVFNEEGNLVTKDSLNNETLSAGDVTTLVAKLKGSYQRGQPYGGIIVADWNSTDFDNVIVNFGGAETDVPSVYSVLTGRKAKAYTVPAILSNAILEGSVTIDVDDTNNPSAVDSANVTLTYYPNNYYVNMDIGAIFTGPAVEDENDAQTIAYSSVLGITVA